MYIGAGIDVVDQNGNRAGIKVNGSFEDLVAHGILAQNGMRNQETIGNVGPNLLSDAEIVVDGFDDIETIPAEIAKTLLLQENISFD